MRDFYSAYYATLPSSRAHAAFCEQAYGRDLGQHGFMTEEQFEFLLGVTQPDRACHIADLGCGHGAIARVIAERTGAWVCGMDYIPEALAQARAAATDARGPHYAAGDLNQLPFGPRAFDLMLSIDALYFASDYVEALRNWRRCLKPGGRMALFFSHGANPECPKERFRREELPPDCTPLAKALQEVGLTYDTWDFTRADYELAQRKRAALQQLEAEFDREGHRFLYENRLGETLGVIDAVETGMHARYLYLTRPAAAT